MANCEFAHGHVTRGKYPVPSEKPTIFEVVRDPGNAKKNVVFRISLSFTYLKIIFLNHLLYQYILQNYSLFDNIHAKKVYSYF